MLDSMYVTTRTWDLIEMETHQATTIYGGKKNVFEQLLV